MKLLVIAGFLGSGKTTLLLEVARKLAAASQKIAIIENEVGEIGIDGKYLLQEGCKLIGHIKGLPKVEGNDHLFFSITSFEEKARRF
jgi:G3E family GTPase